MHKNTIFFLGAGFSKGAGAPLQSELMSKVLSFDGFEYDMIDGDFRQKKNKVVRFLTDAFNLRQNHILKMSLEDVYTPIDKCISEGASFRGYSYKGLANIRSILSNMISIVIDHELVNAPYEQKEYVGKFADFVVDSAVNSNNGAIIVSTNWDILVDRAIVESSYRVSPPKIKIDYGTSMVPIHSEAERHLYNSKDIGDDYRPVRLYKMHGSLNWLKCPTCNRIYADPQWKIALNEMYHNTCKTCEGIYHEPASFDENNRQEECGIYLEPEIIVPTFLKNFSNVHYQRIWDSVGESLSEAKKIVFMGYSFPQADFELRQLISRRLSYGCEIDVVLKTDDEKEPAIDSKGYDYTEFGRYRNFFGKRKINFHCKGVADYIDNQLIQTEVLK